jgi:hypothetical protein
MHFRRRPSASMVVALLALFASLGGVGYAATQLPAGSVGTDQLQNASVTNHKILNGSVGNFKLAVGAVGPRKMMNGAVGKTQIDTSQVQARVAGTCSSGAVTAVSATGAVTCNSAPPQELDKSSTTPVTVSSTSTTPTPIVSEPLPGGSSYLVLANPYVTITNTTANQQVEVDCALAVGPSTGAVQSRSVTVNIGANPSSLANTIPPATSIPLVVTAPSSTNSITATVACKQLSTTGTPAPTVTVLSNINALQTAGNTTAAAAKAR